MRNKGINIIILLLLFLGTQLTAQYYPYRQFTINDGLPSNNVYGMLEDDDGFLWIYTEKGISKFDGYEFKNYSIEDGLPANDIFLMRKNSDGRIWMLGPEGSTGYIEKDSIFKMDLGIQSHTVFQKIEQNLYYWSSQKIWSIEGNNIHQDKITLDYFTLKYPNFKWTLKNKNIYWGIDLKNQELIQMDSAENIIKKIKFDTNIGSDHYSHRSQFIDAINPYFLSITSNGIHQIEVSSTESVFYPWSHFFDHPTNMFLINTEENLTRISTNNGIVTITDYNELNSVNLSSLAKKYALQRSFQDSEGNIWTGTKEDGLLFFSRNQLKANLIETENEDDNTYKFIKKLSSGDLIAISSRGSVYNITSGKKIIKGNPENTFVTDALLTESDELLITRNLGKGRYIPFNNNNKSSIDKRLKNHQISKIPSGSVNLLGNSKNIINRSNSDFYTSIRQGLFRVFINDNNLPESEKVGHIQRLLHKSPFQNDIYAADKEKLYRINENQELEDILTLPLISSLRSNNENELIIGTESSGIYKYTFDENELTKIGNYGAINQIRTNNTNSFYISTNGGIKKVVAEEDTSYVERTWGLNQGLPSLEVFDFIIDEDHLYACTSNGIAKIGINNTNKTPSNNPEKLKIQGIIVNGKKVDSNRNFSHSENDITLDYSLLDKKSFGQISYRYKLPPIQTEWKTTNDRSIIFNNLAPNNYTFNLEAYDSDGTNYQLQEEIQFTIKNPFWKTAIFYLGLILGTLLLFMFVDNRRRKEMEKKMENEIEISKSYNRRMANLKLEALRSQMNPHFVFNSLGAIQYYIQTHKIEEADNYLTLFANLMRKYLNSSSEQMIILYDELSLLKDYVHLEKIRFEGMFDVKFLIDNGIDLKNVFLPSMMIQPFVENAINHGLLHRKDKKALLSISIVENSQKEIIIEVSDNGIGRDNAKKFQKKFHKSKGMLNVSNRIESLKAAELVNIKINITNNTNDDAFPGTKVVINLKKNEQWNTQLSS